jgi:type IV secretion system protein TrbJ
MNRRDFLTMSLSIPLAAILLPKNSYATGLIAGATEFTQITNMVQLIMQYATQIEQYAAQVESLQNHIQQTQMMIQNLRNLPAGVWNKFSSDVLALKNIVQQGQAVSFAAANIDTQFASVYKGYSNYESSAAQSLGDRATTFAQQYKLLNTSTRDSTNGALKALNTQMNAMSTDEGVMNMLQNQSRSADGQLKAVQAANEIAIHQTDTLKKLQYTLMTQASTQAAYQAAQNEKETAQRALSERRSQYSKPNINRTGNPQRFEQFR